MNLNIRILAVILTGFVACHQAAAADYFSKTETPATPAKVYFDVPAGMRSTVTVYENPVDCSKMHVVEIMKLGVHETIYVPQTKFFTFAVALQKGTLGDLTVGDLMYTVPFDSGDVRITVNYDVKHVWAAIESEDAQGWHPVEGAVQRRLTRPFFGSDWCPADQAFAS